MSSKQLKYYHSKKEEINAKNKNRYSDNKRCCICCGNSTTKDHMEGYTHSAFKGSIIGIGILRQDGHTLKKALIRLHVFIPQIFRSRISTPTLNKIKKNKLPPLSKVKTYILPLTKDKKK